MNENSIYFNKDRIFYINSFGGSGSMMLFWYLSNFGIAYHIHSRYPPDRLRKIDLSNKIQHYNYVDNWSNYREVDDDKIKNYKVIYIYRDPIKAMYSVSRRFPFHNHMKSIQCSIITRPIIKKMPKKRINIKYRFVDVNDFKTSKYDICGLENFFDNYTQKKNKNYNIYCIKYEIFFDIIESFNKTLELEDIKELYPIKKEHPVVYENYDILSSNQYRNLFCKMKSLPPIYII